MSILWLAAEKILSSSFGWYALQPQISVFSGWACVFLAACNSLVVSRRLNSRGAEALAEVWQQRPAQCGLLAGKAMYISFLRKIFALCASVRAVEGSAQIHWATWLFSFRLSSILEPPFNWLESLLCACVPHILAVSCLLKKALAFCAEKFIY